MDARSLSSRHGTFAWCAVIAVTLGACSGSNQGNHNDATVHDAADAFDVTVPDVHDATTPDVAAVDAIDVSSDIVVTDATPLTAPNEQWTWIDLPETQCADGTPTGVGVNLTHRSDNVLIFLEGGGACWDAASCWGPVMTSFYIATGYGAAQFYTDPQIPAMLPLRRADTNNPFRNMNMIYVPYCTGDVHAGDNVVTYNYLGIDHVTHHVGWRNLNVILRYLQRTFPTTTRVWLAGDSAGGFGAAINFGLVQSAFPGARVDVLDDSGQPIQPDPARWPLWRAAWNIHFPPDCANCSTDIGAFVDYYRDHYPGHRFGLISFTNDSVITTFMGLTPTEFNTELTALGAHMDATWPTGHYYFIAGITHVGLLAPPPGLITWLDQMVNDDPAWTSVHP